MIALQEMMQSINVAMEATGIRAQRDIPQGPTEGSKDRPSKASVVPQEGPELLEDQPEAPTRGPIDKGPLGGENTARVGTKGRPKWVKQSSMMPKRPDRALEGLLTLLRPSMLEGLKTPSAP